MEQGCDMKIGDTIKQVNDLEEAELEEEENYDFYDENQLDELGLNGGIFNPSQKNVPNFSTATGDQPLPKKTCINNRISGISQEDGLAKMKRLSVQDLMKEKELLEDPNASGNKIINIKKLNQKT